MSTDTSDNNVEIWKIKKLIQKLDAARGNGTSMISLIVKPGDKINKVSKMLADEYETASNIKSLVNRSSVLSAITSTQQKLKLYNRLPGNGLVVYCGTIITQEGKEKKVNIDFEPFRPVNTSLYLCDKKFHTEVLSALLEDNIKFGFIIVDGNGGLFGTLAGNSREVLHKFGVELPKMIGGGGQSALRFAQLRKAKRYDYIRKVYETAVQLFISDDKVNVEGLVLASSADFKNELCESDMFDQRLQSKVLKRVDVSYGAEQGFNQAIELSADCLTNVDFIQEQNLIKSFFEEIYQSTDKYCIGVEDTMRAFEMGVVKILIVWENLPVTRYLLRNKNTEEEKVLLLRPEINNNVDLEVVDEQLLIDYLIIKYKEFDVTLEFVGDGSPEGKQFVKGFGGIGGFLRHKVDFQEMGVEHIGTGDDNNEDNVNKDEYLKRKLSSPIR